MTLEAPGDAPARVAKLVVVGVGLIGGSCALALRRAGAVGEVVGIGRTRDNLATAKARGIVDRVLTLDDAWQAELADADVVLLATPVAQLPELFAAIARHVGPDTVVTDAGSTKQDVIAAARANLGPAFVRFVPGHPIAGTEHTGAAAAFDTLYRDRNVVLAPVAQTAGDAVERVRNLWSSCGATVRLLDPAVHDRVFAAVSHLPHVLAFALVDDLALREEASLFFEFAASGFRDFTRIAAGSPEMWRDIVLANRDAVLAEIDAFRQHLERMAAHVAASDGDALFAMLSRAAEARRAWARERGTAAPADGPRAP